jgi:feruloyl esterase
MTVAGKKLVAAYYDQPHRRAYYQGCSTGGRMGLMEAQRFPADYDLISAGAPVYTLQVQNSAVLRNVTFARNGGGFSADDLALAQRSSLAACDADDGLADGLINKPPTCTWDPGTIQCTGAKTASCLAPAQVEALRFAYSGTREPNGEWAMLPMSRGGEAGWSRFVGTGGTGADATGGGGLQGLAPLILGGRPFDFANFSMADVRAVRASDFAEMYEAKDPDLAAFFRRGGKLLLWHGESDPGPSPVGTNDYVRAVLAGVPAAARNMRYFLLPGTEHCGGGPGASRVAWLETLENWDDSGRAPEVVHGGGPGAMIRPHCAWPDVARYKGSGDANDPASWQCVRRS